jgi:CheY-like chemotaxis protein
VDNDITFYVRTELGNASYDDSGVTMSPAFRRMLRELDGTRSVSELAPLFPHLDAEDLELWLSELLRQQMIQRIPKRLVSAAQRIREAAPMPAGRPTAPPAPAPAPRRAEQEVRQIAQEIQPWLSELGKCVPQPEPGNELTRTARMAAVEASTTASSIGREGFFMSPAGVRQPLAPDARRLILVVEDDELQANMAARILESDGYLIRLAASGASSRAALLERPVPDLVLLDVELPDTDGFTLLKQMRAHPLYQLLRVVMLTARADRADIAKGILLGADGYLTKPYRPEMIKMAVRQALQA